MGSALETRLLPKLRSLESILHPINRLPRDVFTLIPHFFGCEEEDCDVFPMNIPLVVMTHVCQSWRNVLLSTPSLWTHIDFSTSQSKQAECFLARSGNQLLDVYQYVRAADGIEPFLSTTLRNTHRLRRLEVDSHSQCLKLMLGQFAKPAPELKHLEIMVNTYPTNRSITLPSAIFGGQIPKLTSLSLEYIRADLRDLNFPSLMRFRFVEGTNVSVQDLTSFFRRHPSLEFIQICIASMPAPPTVPPSERVCLAALKELRFSHKTCLSGLLDHLSLPTCTEAMLKGESTGDEVGHYDPRVTRIHPSSIDHLPVTKGITKVVAMPNSCVLSGPNGNLRFWGFRRIRGTFDAQFFTPFSPISVLEIRELWVVHKSTSYIGSARRFLDPTAAEIRSAFKVPPKVEDLTLVGCRTERFFSALGMEADGVVLLPGLQRLTLFVGWEDLDFSALIQSAKARKEHAQPLGQVTIVFEEEPEADLVEGVEMLKEFVGESIYRVSEPPKLYWLDEGCDYW